MKFNLFFHEVKILNKNIKNFFYINRGHEFQNSCYLKLQKSNFFNQSVLLVNCIEKTLQSARKSSFTLVKPRVSRYPKFDFPKKASIETHMLIPLTASIGFQCKPIFCNDTNTNTNTNY